MGYKTTNSMYRCLLQALLFVSSLNLGNACSNLQQFVTKGNKQGANILSVQFLLILDFIKIHQEQIHQSHRVLLVAGISWILYHTRQVFKYNPSFPFPISHRSNAPWQENSHPLQLHIYVEKLQLNRP